MKGKNLIILAVLAIVLVGLASFSSRKHRKDPTDTTGKKVFADLAVNDVTTITIKTADRETTLTKDQGKWICASKQNYPAQFEKIKSALIKLSDLKIGLTIKADEAQRKALKIATPAAGAPGAVAEGSTLVALRGAGDKTIATLILGAPRMRKGGGNPAMGGDGYPDGRYLSPDNGKSVYLVSDALEEVSAEPKTWLDTELLNLESSEITDITVAHTNGAPYRLSRTGSTWTLDGLAADEETDDSKAGGMGGALAYLRFDDVAAPTLTDEQTGMAKPITYTATTTNDLIYTVRIGTDSGSERYIRIAASLTAATAATGTNAVAAAEVRKAREQKVKEFNATFGGWTYLMSSYKTDNMMHTRDTLTKKKEKPAENAGTNVTTSAAEPAPAS